MQILYDQRWVRLRIHHIKTDDKWSPALLFCLTVLVAERSPLITPDLLELDSATRFINAPLEEAPLLPFWASMGKSPTAKDWFPGVLLRTGDEEDKRVSPSEHFLLVLFLSFISWFPYKNRICCMRNRTTQNKQPLYWGKILKRTDQCIYKCFESPRLQM